MNKKIKFLIIGIAIVVLIGIIVALSFIFGAKKIIKEEEISEYTYLLYNEKNKYGVIDRSGNVVIEANYDMVQIPNPQKDVFICLYDYNQETLEYKSKVLNKNNEQILTKYDDVYAIEVKDTSLLNSYKTTVLKYKLDNKFGLITIDGKILTKAIYNEIENLEYKQGVLLVQKEGLYGVINLNGKKVIKTRYENILADKYSDKDTKYDYAGYIVCKKVENEYSYGYVNYRGKTILDNQYNEIKRITEIKDNENVYLQLSKDGKIALNKNKKTIIDFKCEDIAYNSENLMFIIKTNKKYSVVDINGKEIIPAEYTDLSISGIYIYAKKAEQEYIYNLKGELVQDLKYSKVSKVKDGEYYITIDNNELCGVLDNNQNEIVPNEYNYIQYAFENYFIVSKNGKVGMIDSRNQVVINIEYLTMQNYSEANMIKAIKDKETSDFYNLKLELLVEMKNANIEIFDEYVKIYSNDEVKYFNLQGEEILPSQALKNNTLFAINKNGKWGFENSSKAIVIECKYDYATEFNEFGYAGIKMNEKWGVINTEGKVIIQPVYKLNGLTPTFIDKYYRVYNGYGQPYYAIEMGEDNV